MIKDFDLSYQQKRASICIPSHFLTFGFSSHMLAQLSAAKTASKAALKKISRKRLKFLFILIHFQFQY